MVGLFINTLPVRIQIRPNAKSTDWLTEFQEQQAETSEFEHVSSSRYAEVVGLEVVVGDYGGGFHVRLVEDMGGSEFDDLPVLSPEVEDLLYLKVKVAEIFVMESFCSFVHLDPVSVKVVEEAV